MDNRNAEVRKRLSSTTECLASFGVFDANGHLFPEVVVMADRKDFVVWDNRAASAQSRHGSQEEAEDAAFYYFVRSISRPDGATGLVGVGCFPGCVHGELMIDEAKVSLKVSCERPIDGARKITEIAAALIAGPTIMVGAIVARGLLVQQDYDDAGSVAVKAILDGAIDRNEVSVEAMEAALEFFDACDDEDANHVAAMLRTALGRTPRS